VNELLKALSAAGVGDRTRQNVRKVLHAAYRSATDMALISRNPISAVRPPKAADREQVVLTQDEATRLLEAARPTHWFALVSLALVSGMREGELFALTVSDLRLDDAHPHLLVNKTLTEAEDGTLVRTEPKTKASKRRVDLDPETAAVLRKNVDGLRKGDYVFTTADGSVIRKSNFLRRVWHPMLDGAGLPRVTFHSLRHVVNTLLLAGGSASHLDLAARLGHSSPRMTLERYARVVPGAQAKIAVVARGFFGVQLPPSGATGGATRSEKPDSTDPYK